MCDLGATPPHRTSAAATAARAVFIGSSASSATASSVAVSPLPFPFAEEATSRLPATPITPPPHSKAESSDVTPIKVTPAKANREIIGYKEEQAGDGSLSQGSHVQRLGAIDWPLSREEKKTCVLSFYERDLQVADRLLREKEAALIEAQAELLKASQLYRRSHLAASEAGSVAATSAASDVGHFVAGSPESFLHQDSEGLAAGEEEDGEEGKPWQLQLVEEPHSKELLDEKMPASGGMASEEEDAARPLELVEAAPDEDLIGDYDLEGSCEEAAEDGFCTPHAEQDEDEELQDQESEAEESVQHRWREGARRQDVAIQMCPCCAAWLSQQQQHKQRRRLQPRRLRLHYTLVRSIRANP